MNLHDEISKVAYDLYLRRGCVHGHDLDDWLEAERIVLARHAGQEIEEPEAEEQTGEETIVEAPSVPETEETVIEETETPVTAGTGKKRERKKTVKKAEEKPKKTKKAIGKKTKKKE